MGCDMLTKERACELLHYVPETGELIWRVTKSAKAVVGTVAGSVNAKGHINLQIDGRMYAAHQVVFIMHHGWLPVEIDHADRDKTNNRIGNLRPATSSQNKGNIGLLRTNSSGYKGVSQNSRSGKWHAQIKVHGRQTYLGRFDTPEQAALRYNEAAKQHFGEFAYLNEVVQ